MPWANYHSHTHYCDGTDKPETYLQAAEKLGLVAYGFSSHAPVPYPSCQWAMKQERLLNYISEVNALKNTSEVEVYLCLEIDYVPEEMGPSSPWIKEAQLDYSLASVHFVDFHKNGDPWETDGLLGEFEKGLHGIFNGDARKAVERYNEITRHMVEHDCPQIIGHLDKIKMQNSRKPFFSEEENWYQKEIQQTLECIAATEAIVEVNTRGLYKKRAFETYPGRKALELCRDMHIPLMLNSDGHHPREIIAEFETAAELLTELGIKQLWAFIGGQFQPFPFNKQGLIIS